MGRGIIGLAVGALLLAWGGPGSTAAAAGPGGLPQERSPSPQQRPVPFGAEVELVLVDAAVVDRDGRFIHGLGPEHFRVFEEDQEVEIRFFAVERFTHRAEAAEVRELPVLSRYMVLFIDGMNTVPQDWLRVRPHLIRWLREGLEPNDRVLLAALYPNGRVRITPEFTRDVDFLAGALMQVEANRDLSFRILEQERELFEVLGLEVAGAEGLLSSGAEFEAARLRQGAQLAVSYASQRRREVFRALEYLGELARHLDRLYPEIQGPKVVIMVSGGLPEIPGLNFQLIVEHQADLASPATRAQAGLRTFQPLIQERSSLQLASDVLWRAIGEFNRLNYLFYTIHARGHGGDGDGGSLQPYAPLLPPHLRAAVERNEERGLVTLAEGTGGLAFLNTSNFGGVLQRIQEDTAFRYVLGYVPPPREVGGGEARFARIRVEVTVPGARVRARQGYVRGGA